jgi:uncharacterized damage-inducible protein DinB
MTPEQAGFMLNSYFLPNLVKECATTKSVIAAVPADQNDFRPDAVSKTAMELVWHIVAAEMRFVDAVINAHFDLTPNPRPEHLKTAGDVAVFYGEQMEARFEKLKATSNETLATEVDFRGMFKMPAVMYLGFDMHHIIHHRGQLSAYLRPAGGKVPAIYGESHDSAEARKAAQA